MRRITTVTGIVLATLVACQSLIGQPTHRKRVQPREYVEDLRKRPDLAVNYSRVAKFKLGSRKTTYRLGEMISIDLAIMNVSNTPVFFHEPFLPGLVLDALDEKGTQVLINDYAIAFEAISPESYRQIEPGHLVLASFQLLAGCTGDLDAFLEQKHKLTLAESGRGEAAYLKRVFEGSLFVSWGQACFSAKSPGKYTISAEQSNDTVLVSPNRPKVKTAVGRIRSSSLTLTITE